MLLFPTSPLPLALTVFVIFQPVTYQHFQDSIPAMLFHATFGNIPLHTQQVQRASNPMHRSIPFVNQPGVPVILHFHHQGISSAARPVRKDMWWWRRYWVDGHLYLGQMLLIQWLSWLYLYLYLYLQPICLGEEGLNLLGIYFRRSWRSHTRMIPVLPRIQLIPGAPSVWLEFYLQLRKGLGLPTFTLLDVAANHWVCLPIAASASTYKTEIWA